MKQIQARECKGSPVERYTVDGFWAERKFFVPWEQRDAFASHLLGDDVCDVRGLCGVENADTTKRGRLAYPGKPRALVVQIDFEPEPTSTFYVPETSNPATTLPKYGAFVIATVRYSTK